MPDNKETGAMSRWDGKWGPASAIGAIQIVVVVGTVVLAIGSFKEANENARQAVTELRTIVSEMQKASIINGERITRVETKVDFLITATVPVPAKKVP